MDLKPVPVDGFARFRYLSHPQFSPSGKTLCYVVTEADTEKNGYKSYIYKRRDGKDTKLTAGGKESGFIFLDENTLLFGGDRDPGKEPTTECKYYTISLDGGEAEKAFTFPIPVSDIRVLKNGDLIMLGTVTPGYEDLYQGDKKRAAAFLKDKKENEDYEVLLENPWWWNGGTYTKGAYQSLFTYSRKRKKLTRLTEQDISVLEFELSPDEKKVYYCGTKRTQHQSYDAISLFCLNTADGSHSCIFEGGDRYILYDIVAGESFAILALADRAGMGGNSNPDFYRLDYETGTYTPYATFGEGLGSSVGSDIRYGGGRTMKMQGDTLYFIATLYDGAYLMKLENGAVTKVPGRDGSADSFDIRGDDIVICGLYGMQGTELYDGKGRQLTHFNDKALRGLYVAEPKRLDAENGGHRIHGYVLEPIGFDPGKKYPVILDIHGGPKTVYGPVYYHEMQYWAGRGFFVIFCNPTGSDGRGNAFADICGKYGTVDYEDIMAFTDTALAAYPQMDAGRLYETGGSYGGFMTNWIIGHTDRFRACATQRSISNWFSFYGVSDIGIDFTVDQNLSSPWQDPEKLWAHSPMKFYDKVKTPTLIIHSLEDYRCPVDQGYQLFTSLCDHGVETRMVLFRGENHDLSRTGKPKHRVRRLKEITSWFETH